MSSGRKLGRPENGRPYKVIFIVSISILYDDCRADWQRSNTPARCQQERAARPLSLVQTNEKNKSKMCLGLKSCCRAACHMSIADHNQETDLFRRSTVVSTMRAYG